MPALTADALTPAVPPVSVATTPWAVLLNPRSLAMRRGWRAVEALANRHGIPMLRAETPDDIDGALDAALAGGAARVAVAGGDGTLQAVVTALLARDPAPTTSLLALPGGRTNFVARDLGFHRDADAALSRLLDRRCDQLRTQTRHVVEIVADDGRVHRGFFAAGAIVDDVIRDLHRQRRGRTAGWHASAVSTPFCVLQWAAAAVFGTRRQAAPRLAIDADALGRLEAACRLLLVSTLEHRDHWLNPYAARGTGALRVTAVAVDARGWRRRLPRLLRGRYRDDMDEAVGYLSGRVPGELRIRGLARLTLDGEELDFDPDTTLVARAGPAVRFLLP